MCEQIEVLAKEIIRMLVQGEDVIGKDGKSQISVLLNPRRRISTMRMIYAMDVIHHMLLHKKQSTQRELFYRAQNDDTCLFQRQNHMDRTLMDLAGICGVSRADLNVFTAEKGLIAGQISFLYEGQQTSVMQSGSIPISHHLIRCDNTSSGRYIVVVEKDSFFHHLLETSFVKSFPCVLMTGKGYPDFYTRELLETLVRQHPNMPPVYIGDFDPHGLHIYLTYRESCPRLRWVGLHWEDVQKLPVESALAVTQTDEKLIQRLKGKHGDKFDEQLEFMTRKKFELEALHSLGRNFAADYFPQKILRSTFLDTGF